MGAFLPALMVLMGKMTNVFINYEFMKTISENAADNSTGIKDILCNTNLNETEFYDILKQLFNSTMNVTLENVYIRLNMDKHEFIYEINQTLCFGAKTFIETFKSDAAKFSGFMGIVGVLTLLCSYVMVACLSSSACNQAYRIKIQFFRSVLHQDITWFDTKTSGDFATKINRLKLFHVLISHETFIFSILLFLIVI